MSLEVRGLSFSYGDRSVLSDISFRADAGEVLSILGPNGVGKSTLMRCILGLLSDYTGQVLVDGVDTRTLSVRRMAQQIACIPQSSHPVFYHSVFDMVLMGVSSTLSPLQTPKEQDAARCMQALEKLGIAHLAKRCYHRLSGGEQQLVLLARALVQQAPVLMLDEPTASLDFGNQLIVLAQIRRLADEGYTVLLNTHHPEHSYRFSDRILALKHGRILTEGLPADVLTPTVMAQLYGVAVDVVSLREDRYRVCIPCPPSQEDLS